MSPVVSTALSPGDVIGEERPLVHVMFVSTKHMFCNHCLSDSAEDLKKCSKCRLKWYCSPECQSADWVYHRRECRVYRKGFVDTDRWPEEHQLLLRLYLYLQSIGSEAADQQIKTFDGQTVALKDVETLPTNGRMIRDRRSPLRNFMTLFAVVGVKPLVEGLLRQCMAILDHYPPIGLQSYSNRWPLSRNGVAVGLYPRFGFKHSCRPNVTLVQYGLSTQLRALRPIAAGDELTMSLIILGQNRRQRRRELEKRHIECHCDRCQHPNADNGINFDLLEQMRDLYLSEAHHSTPERVIELYPKVAKDFDAIYGDYHSTKTDIYHSYLCSLLKTKCPDKELIRQVTKQFKDCVDVTHGPNHPLKSLYKLDRKLLRIGFHKFMLPN